MSASHSSRHTAWLAVCLLALAASGCAGMQLKSNVREVRAIAKEARDRGAYACAPRELALAETNVEFASHELDQGDYFRARDHVRIADRNAREAYNLALRCAPKPVGDRDGDGILDNVDKCPDQPEDKDGFEDEDGCPDPDNDKDGIADISDKCPNEPEDKDKFEDDDGCPDPDNDTDGLADADDKCPNEPEDKDGFEDADGCPDPDNDKDARRRRRRQVPERARSARQRRLPEEVPAHRRDAGEDRAQTEDLLRYQQGDDPAAQLLAAGRDRQRAEIAADHDGPHRRSHRLARDPDAQFEAFRGPCGRVRQHLVGLGIDPVADGVAWVRP